MDRQAQQGPAFEPHGVAVAVFAGDRLKPPQNTQRIRRTHLFGQGQRPQRVIERMERRGAAALPSTLTAIIDAVGGLAEET